MRTSKLNSPSVPYHITMTTADSVSGEEPLRAQRWAPNEVLLMWMHGMSSAQIAAVCNVPTRRVTNFLWKQRRRDPFLAGRRLVPHTEPSIPEVIPRPSWQHRLDETIVFTRRTGRYPTQRSPDKDERSLRYWLSGQRAKERAGTLSAKSAGALDALGEWRRPAKEPGEVELWDRRCHQVAQFIQENIHRPRYKDGSVHEKVLATWLAAQRVALNEGRLSVERSLALRRVFPGWDANCRNGPDQRTF